MAHTFSVWSDSYDPMDCCLPGSSVHGIILARILEWVAISFSRGSSNPEAEPVSSVAPALAGGFFTTELPGKAVWKICVTSVKYVTSVLDQQGHSVLHCWVASVCYQHLPFISYSNCSMPCLQWACPPFQVCICFSQKKLKSWKFSEGLTFNVLRGIYRITKIFHLLALFMKNLLDA